jgi:hypothetical protein
MELLKENKNQFDLFKHFTTDEFNSYDFEMSYNLNYLKNLLDYDITQENVYDILKLADFYQYNKMDELIMKIQWKIFDDELDINEEILNKEDLFNAIIDGNCIKNKFCGCNLLHLSLHGHCKLYHISCYNYLTQKLGKKYNFVNNSNKNEDELLKIYPTLKNHDLYSSITLSDFYIGSDFDDNSDYYHDCDNYKLLNKNIKSIIIDPNEPSKNLINIYTKEYISLINSVCMSGNLKLVRYLLNHDHNLTENSLYYACISNNLQLVKYLHNCGCKNYPSLMHTLCHIGYFEIMKYFIECGYETDVDNIYTLLNDNNIDIVKYLIESDMPWNNNVFIYAFKYNDLELVKYLLDKCRKCIKYENNTIKNMHNINSFDSDYDSDYDSGSDNEEDDTQEDEKDDNIGYKLNDVNPFLINKAVMYDIVDIIRYLLDEGKFFTRRAIKNAKTDQIKLLLCENINQLIPLIYKKYI